MGFLTALLPLLGGLTQPLKDWFSYKQESAKAEQDYRLATLKAQAEMAVQEAKSSSEDLTSRLGATSQSFKQTTFWFLCVPIIYTMFFPQAAALMWANFKLVPDFIQWLFMAVYSSIWSIPVVKGGYGAITDFIQGRREYKIEKAKALNERVLFDELRKKIFTKGLTEQQVYDIKKAVSDSMSDSNN